MQKPVIQFEEVSKRYGEQPVLNGFSLAVNPGEFLTVIGRSGCGKTTALKLVNGLVTPDTGRVLVQDEDVAETEPVSLRRRIGYAIQSAGLFPHMTVEKNIAYVPSISGLPGWTGQERRERCSALLKQVGLDPILMGRYPRNLSGGQRQRVGIARALAAGPDILLMDEPFGAVDQITRSQLQEEIQRIHWESGITILFVTHDIAEALKLGTRVLVLDGGYVQQCAPPEELLRSPATEFVRILMEQQRRICFMPDKKLSDCEFSGTSCPRFQM